MRINNSFYFKKVIIYIIDNIESKLDIMHGFISHFFLSLLSAFSRRKKNKKIIFFCPEYTN